MLSANAMSSTRVASTASMISPYNRSADLLRNAINDPLRPQKVQ